MADNHQKFVNEYIASLEATIARDRKKRIAIEKEFAATRNLMRLRIVQLEDELKQEREWAKSDREMWG